MRALLISLLLVPLLVWSPCAAGAQTTPLAPLTLPETIARVRASSPLMKAALAQLVGAQLGRRFAGRLPNPTVAFQTENLGYRSMSVPSMAPGLDVFALASQTIELGGKRGARVGLAAAAVDLADASLSSVGRQLTLEAVRRYVSALRALGGVEVLATNLEELSELVETMERRVEQGFAAEADLEKFRTEAARLGLRLARERLDLERATALLAALLAADERIDARRLVDPPPIDPPPGEADDLARLAAVDHPNVRIAQAQLQQAEQALRHERAGRVPDAVVTGGFKHTAGEGTGVVGLSVQVPLFDRNRSNVARAEAEMHAASFGLEETRRRVRLETSVLVERARGLASRAATADDQLLQPAVTVRQAAQAAFQEGAADVLSLIDAERVYGEVRRDVVDLRLDAYLAAVEARLALGLEPIP